MSKALAIKGLKKTYSDGFSALNGLDLSVDEGDFYALLGPNGAGKSTTIGIITSLVKKSEGSVKILGYDLDTDYKKALSMVGVVPQEFNFQVYDKVINIIYNQAGFYGISRAQAKEKVEYYLKKMLLWDKRNTPANKLSGGMKRRLMIVRALVHEPKLLILDEPTAGVDLEIRHDMWSFLQQLNQDKKMTIILTTHYLEEAEKLCKNVGIIVKGKLIEQTNMKSLLSRYSGQSYWFELADDNHSTKRIDRITELSNEQLRIEHIEDNHYKAHLKESLALNDLIQKLQSNQFKLASIRQAENRLERKYMEMTQS